MQVTLVTCPFNPWLELNKYQTKHASSDCGACAVFLGTMRDFNLGDRVYSMTLEHYPGMTEKQLEIIVKQNVQRYKLSEALVIHRVGVIQPSEPIVLVATFSYHRKQAFAACRQIMEDLKHKAPFWKQEQLESSKRWLLENTKG